MNGRTARKLRRLAEAKTLGMPSIKYTGVGRGTIFLHDDCTRSAYKKLKKEA